MSSSDIKTLLVKHLPRCLTKKEKEDFLKYIGAEQVKVCGSDNKENFAFAKFKTNYIAREVLYQLHQKELLGSRLVVEFAKNELNFNKSVDEDEQSRENEKEDNVKMSNMYDSYVNKLNKWSTGLDFSLPPPHHLSYRYPPPTGKVLVNVVNALCSVKKFYIQVLHLMNRMNLACPFEEPFPHTNCQLYEQFVHHVQNEIRIRSMSSSSSESELESDEDAKAVTVQRPKKVVKRSISIRSMYPSSAMPLPKRPKVISVEDVFDKVDSPKKKIDVKMPVTMATPKTESEFSTTEKSLVPEKSEEQNDGGFGIIEPVKKPSEEEQVKQIDNMDERSVSEAELAANRISQRDWKILAVFKDYEAGNPSCRLYIKNLSKRVTVADLNYIYRRYWLKDDDQQGTMFDIRLMQEGRMKGQAFVTLQNAELAQRAVRETNGFILKEKPMVVQFARSAPARSK